MRNTAKQRIAEKSADEEDDKEGSGQDEERRTPTDGDSDRGSTVGPLEDTAGSDRPRSRGRADSKIF